MLNYDMRPDDIHAGLKAIGRARRQLGENIMGSSEKRAPAKSPHTPIPWTPATILHLAFEEDVLFAVRAANQHEKLVKVLRAIHKRATPRSQDFLHPTKEFADDVARLAHNAIEEAEKAS